MSAPDYAEAYAHPEVYDVLHSPHTAGEIDLFERCAREWNAPKGPWLEPACGSGRYLRVLADRGIRCTGFDLDDGMLDYARAEVRRAGHSRRVRLVRADMASFTDAIDGEFAVAFNPVNTFRHLHRPRQAAAHLREVARALLPGGLYLVGMSFSRYGEEEASEDVWTAKRGDIAVRQIVQYLPPDPATRMETVFSHLQVDRAGRKREYLDSTYALRSYDLDQWKGLVRRSPLKRVGAIDDLGNPVTDDIETNYQIEVLRKG